MERSIFSISSAPETSTDPVNLGPALSCANGEYNLLIAVDDNGTATRCEAQPDQVRYNIFGERASCVCDAILKEAAFTAPGARRMRAVITIGTRSPYNRLWIAPFEARQPVLSILETKVIAPSDREAAEEVRREASECIAPFVRRTPADTDPPIVEVDLSMTLHPDGSVATLEVFAPKLEETERVCLENLVVNVPFICRLGDDTELSIDLSGPRPG